MDYRSMGGGEMKIIFRENNDKYDNPVIECGNWFKRDDGSEFFSSILDIDSKNREVETDCGDSYMDYSISFDVDAKYEGFSYDLSSKFYDRYSQAIPFDETKKLPFTPNYILGFYADAKDVEGNTYLDNAMDDAAADYKKRILSVKEMARYGCSKPSAIKFDQIEQKTGMFPLYFLAIRNKNQKNINYAIVNGQTGKLVTELPVSYPKYIIGSLILSAIIFLLINSSLILNPQEVCSAAIGFAIIGLIINFIQAISLSNRETHSDDEGLQSVKKDSNSVSLTITISSIKPPSNYYTKKNREFLLYLHFIH